MCCSVESVQHQGRKGSFVCFFLSLFTIIRQLFIPTMLTARLTHPHSPIKSRDVVITWRLAIITHQNRWAQPFYFVSGAWKRRSAARRWELGARLRWRMIPLIPIDAPRERPPDTCVTFHVGTLRPDDECFDVGRGELMWAPGVSEDHLEANCTACSCSGGGGAAALASSGARRLKKESKVKLVSATNWNKTWHLMDFLLLRDSVFIFPLSCLFLFLSWEACRVPTVIHSVTPQLGPASINPHKAEDSFCDRNKKSSQWLCTAETRWLICSHNCSLLNATCSLLRNKWG